MNTKLRLAIHSVIAIVSAPFIVYPLFYSMRWVLTGKWVEGGGERAGIGIMIAMLLSLGHLITFAYHDLNSN